MADEIIEQTDVGEKTFQEDYLPGDLNDPHLPEIEAEYHGEEPPAEDAPETEAPEGEAETDDAEMVPAKRLKDTQRRLTELAEEVKRLKTQTPPAEPPANDPAPETVAAEERRTKAYPIAARKFQRYIAQGYTEKESIDMAWEDAYDVVDTASAIANERVAEFQPIIERMEAPRVVQSTVREVMQQYPSEYLTEQELADGIMASFPEFTKLTAEQRGQAALAARRLLLGEKLDTGAIAPKAAAPKPDPARVPNTGPGIAKASGQSAAAAQYAPQVAHWRAVMGREGDGISDEQVIARIKEYERERKR